MQFLHLGKEKSEMGLSIESVKELMAEFSKGNLITMKVSIGGDGLELSKCGEAAVSVVDKSGQTEEKKPSAVDNENKEGKPEGVSVNAPVAGIFYRAKSPEDKPFVEVGSRVKKGDTIGLIEAMKMVNDINAPCDGVITKIDACNGKFAEFGACLMVIGKE